MWLLTSAIATTWKQCHRDENVHMLTVDLHRCAAWTHAHIFIEHIILFTTAEYCDGTLYTHFKMCS
jgi:hypothetical protein